jgi:hypothetical protein
MVLSRSGVSPQMISAVTVALVNALLFITGNNPYELKGIN